MASARETLSSGVCEQQRCRPACASAQSGQCLCYSFITFIESIISRLATSEISIYQLVSVAEKAGLNLTLSETQRQVFSHYGREKKSCLRGFRPREAQSGLLNYKH